MTKTDWRTLDARIARGVMGWDLQPLHYHYRQRSTLRWMRRGRAFAGFFPANTIQQRVELGAIWQPHKVVAQALMVLETLSQNDVNYSITRFAKQEVIVQLWGYLAGHFVVRRRTGEIVREIICLAIEAWLDAQGLPDAATG